MSYIYMKNLSVIFGKNKLFNDISISIEKGSLISVTTPSSKGKTTFLNLLNGNINSDNVFIDNKLIDSQMKSKIALITSSSYNIYSKTVFEELLLCTNNINRIKKYLKAFNLINLINEVPQELNYIDIKKIEFIKALLNKCEIILFDNIFSYLDKYEKIEFIGLIKKYQEEKNLTIIYTTNNMEDVIFSDRLIIIDKDVLYDGSIDKIYLDEKILKKSKINLSLERELVEKLKLYNLIDNENYTIEEVVDEICK